MITKKLATVNKDYNEMVRVKLTEVYKDITWLDLNEFRKVVIEDVDKIEKDINKFNKNLEKWWRAKRFDPMYRSDKYIEEKTEEAFQVALNAYKREKSIDIVFEETFDDEGNDILEFGVTKLISKYIVPVSLVSDLEVWEIKKFNLED